MFWIRIREGKYFSFYLFLIVYLGLIWKMMNTYEVTANYLLCLKWRNVKDSCWYIENDKSILISVNSVIIHNTYLFWYVWFHVVSIDLSQPRCFICNKILILEYYQTLIIINNLLEKFKDIVVHYYLQYVCNAPLKNLGM